MEISGDEAENYKEQDSKKGLRLIEVLFETVFNKTMQEKGFEPSRSCLHTDLNRARLPFRHSCNQNKRL